MRIAIVAYDFPPLNSGGSQRPYFLAKYLKTQNIDLVVFTLHKENYARELINYEIDSAFSSGCTIVRTNLKKQLADNIFQSYYFNVIDKVGERWKEELMFAIAKEHDTKPFDYLLFSCPPFSLAPVGVFISKRIKVPLILDMRDAWSQWVAAPYATYLHYWLTLKMEAKALEHAALILYVSEQQKLDFLKIHSRLAASKFIYMPNGFEKYIESPLMSNDRIKIFYAGSFYYNPESERLIRARWYKKRPYQYLQFVPRIEEWKYRSPYFFFKILKEFILLHPSLGKKIAVYFAGKKPDWFDDMVSHFGLEMNVVHLGFLNKQLMDYEMQNSNCFLVTSAKVKDGRDICIAGKTYEYFSYKKPILGVVSEGEQKDILEKSGIGIVLDPDDVLTSITKLEEFFKQPQVIPNSNFIGQFMIPNNYADIMSVLKSISKKA